MGVRPECVTEDHLNYLDALRASGAANMYGARPYLMEEFPELGERESAAVLAYWMKSFAYRHAGKDRS